jgi:hypothetical protein
MAKGKSCRRVSNNSASVNASLLRKRGTSASVRSGAGRVLNYRKQEVYKLNGCATKKRKTTKRRKK